MFYYKLLIEYCGSGFAGWQRQANAISVQEVIETAILKFSQENVVVFAAGRTDSGVHALGQVAHFKLHKYFLPSTVLSAINHYIKPFKISIISCCEVDDNFHARFSATARHYLYRILNRSAKTVIDEYRVWWIIEPLDIEKMQQAANYLIGKHDFTSFRAKHCQSQSPVKTLSRIEVSKNDEEIRIYLSAPSFLHHMVRNIVGTLRLVGASSLPPEQVKIILGARDRSKAGPTAPAYGLYLTKVEYKLTDLNLPTLLP